MGERNSTAALRAVRPGHAPIHGDLRDSALTSAQVLRGWRSICCFGVCNFIDEVDGRIADLRLSRRLASRKLVCGNDVNRSKVREQVARQFDARGKHRCFSGAAAFEETPPSPVRYDLPVNASLDSLLRRAVDSD